MTEASAPADPAHAVRRLEERLAATPRSHRPAAHAALQYRLGMALAELPTGPRQLNLSRALAHYDRAAQLFRRDTHPVEHARVLSAKGAALRELGRAEKAVRACRQALAATTDATPAWELAATENNLALALSDSGAHDEAVALARGAAERFDRLVNSGEGLDGQDVEPQRIMAWHNVGQVLSAAGRDQSAIEVYDSALEQVDVERLPYQWALLQHARGVSAHAAGHLDEAIGSFRRASGVFSRTRHPFQYGMVKHNLALVWTQRGTVTDLRRAVAALSDSLATFDPRLHREVWEQSYRHLRAAEGRLAEAGHDAGRVEHFVAVLGEVDTGERHGLARERVVRLLELPEPHRTDKLAALSLAALLLPEERAIVVITALFEVLLELPDEQLRVGLAAHLEAQRSVPEDADVDADWVLERSIADGMLAPQRLRVRDHLTAMGYERP